VTALRWIRLPACQPRPQSACINMRRAHSTKTNDKPPRPRWAVNIKIGRSSVYVGTYADELEAARAWDCAAIAVRGIETRTNFPVENYSQDEVAGMAILLHERQPHLNFHWDGKGPAGMGARRAATGRGGQASGWEGAMGLYAAWWRGQSGAAAGKRGAATVSSDRKRRARGVSDSGGAHGLGGGLGSAVGGRSGHGALDGLLMAADRQLAGAQLWLPADAAADLPAGASIHPLPQLPLTNLPDLLPLLPLSELQQLAAAAAAVNPGDAQAALAALTAAGGGAGLSAAAATALASGVGAGLNAAAVAAAADGQQLFAARAPRVVTPLDAGAAAEQGNPPQQQEQRQVADLALLVAADSSPEQPPGKRARLDDMRGADGAPACVGSGDGSNATAVAMQPAGAVEGSALATS